jgi:hypothetical protein
MGRDRDVTSVVYGYGGTLPVLNVSHAKLSQVRYSSFFDANGISPSEDLLLNGHRQLVPVDTILLGINVPAGSATSNNLVWRCRWSQSVFYNFLLLGKGNNKRDSISESRFCDDNGSGNRLN